MSLVATVRDELATAIAALDTALAGIEKMWVLDVKRDEVTQRSVYLTPDERRVQLVGRGCKTHSIDFWLVIVEPLEAGNEEGQLDANHSLVDLVIDSLYGKRIGAGVVMGMEQSILAYPEHFREFRQHSTFLRITVEV